MNFSEFPRRKIFHTKILKMKQMKPKNITFDNKRKQQINKAIVE